MEDLLRVADLEAGELTELLEIAQGAKRDPAAFTGAGAGRVVAVLFEKPSLRTRFSVEAALGRLGAHPIGAYDQQTGLGSRESVADAARVLERYCDALVVRTFAHERVAELAEHAAIPVLNALSDDHHPLQALADLQTIAGAVCGGDVRALKDVRICYLGDGNNVAHSLIEACGLVSGSIAVGCPRSQEPDDQIVSWATDRGARVEVLHDPVAAVEGADVVYTDVWASMGQEAEASSRRAAFEPYRVTSELMGKAGPEAIFLHCLPAHRGEEVTAEVIDGPASRVFDQAENRMHTTTAVFARLWGLA